MAQCRVWAILSILGFGSGIVRAQDTGEGEPKFSFELDATDDALERGSVVYREMMLRKVKDALLARMPGSKHHGDLMRWWAVEWEKGLWWFSGFEKDRGPIRIQTPAMALKAVVQKLTPLYEALWSAGLHTSAPLNPRVPEATTWGMQGVIHVSKNIFVDNPLLLRNLLVDVHNRAYLEGVFNDFGGQEAVGSVFARGEQDAFLKAIEAVDAKALAKGKYEYKDVLDGLKSIFEHEPGRDISLANLWTKGLQTIEVGMMRGQFTPKDVYDPSRFLSQYLKYLKGKTKPIQPLRFTAVEHDALRSPTLAEAEFRKFVGQLGLKWTDYGRFVENRFPPAHELNKKMGAQVRMADVFSPVDGAYGEADRSTALYEIRIASKGSVRVDGQPVVLTDVETPEGVFRVGNFHKRYTWGGSLDSDRFILEIRDGSGKLVVTKKLGPLELGVGASRPLNPRAASGNAMESLPTGGKDVAADQRLTEVLAWLDRPATKHLADAVRSGSIRVAWVDPKDVGPRSALAKGAEVFLVWDHSVQDLAVELVHEATHVYGTFKNGKPASEAEAFRAEAAFAKEAGLKSLFRYEDLSKMTDAELDQKIRSRWPELYGKAGAVPSHRSVLAAMGQGALGMGFFAGGVVLKEAVQGLVNGEPDRWKEAAKGIATPAFAGGYALFTGLQYATDKGVAAAGMKGTLASATRFSLPLYAGVGILQAVSGRKDPRAAAVDATSFGMAMLATMPVKAALNAAVYPALLAAGPVGWAGIAALEVGQAAAMLWGAEKIAPYVDKAANATVVGVKATASWTAEKSGDAWNAIKNGTGALRSKVVKAVGKVKAW